MVIILIDWLAWKLIQLASLIQGTIFDYALRFARDKKEFFEFMQYSLSGYYIFRMSPNELPDMAKKKLLGRGRLMLGIFLGGFILGKIMEILKEG